MIQDILSIVFILGITTVFSWAVGAQSRLLFDWPIFYWLTALSFLIQTIVFIPSAIFNSEKFYDFTGELTFISITAIGTFTNNDSPYIPQYLAAALVGVWALRLGTFLFSRILKRGQDSRFVQFKKSKIKFYVVWLVQGLWVVFTMSPLLVVMTDKKENLTNGIGWVECVGAAIWLIGLVTETVADHQKSVFSQNPQNHGKFIRTGVWSISRHPNYFGEILVWLGAAIFAIPNLSGWQFLSLISPVFVTILLTKVSGVNLLEQKADKRWGEDLDYQVYKSRTPVLVPCLNICEREKQT